MSAEAASAYAALDDALRRSAEALADALVTRARDDANARLEQARQDAEAVVERARLEGEATAAEQVAHEQAMVRRDAASTVLAAQQAMLEELHNRVREAVLALRDAPDYPDVVNGLGACVRAQLGSGARVESDPEGRGGVRALLDSRRVDDTLDALADRAFDAIAGRLQQRWQ